MHFMEALLAVLDQRRILVEVDCHAQILDLAFQYRPAVFIELHGHQPRREFDDMGFQSQIPQGFRRFQPQQAAADHRAHLRLFGGGGDGFQVLDRAIHQAPVTSIPRHWRHERTGAGSQHQFVIVDCHAVG